MKNRKWLKVFAIIIPLFLVGVMVYLYQSIQDKKAKVEALNQIPKFRLKTISGQIYSSENLWNQSNKMIIYFDVECHYCHAEAEELYKIYTKYPNIEWVWISSNDIKDIADFAKQYKLDNIQNIKWCYDDMSKLYVDFGMSSVPYFIGYDKDNELKIRQKGVSKLESLIKNFE